MKNKWETHKIRIDFLQTKLLLIIRKNEEVLKLYCMCTRLKVQDNIEKLYNNLFKNPIVFCKFLSPIKLYRNGFVFKICIGSQFSAEKTIWKSDTWLPRYVQNKHCTIFL